ncbi:MAG: hypothetical protein PUI85_03460 [Eubacteriales bacterium]|nr:hypothetical protein [Eubacteriales bacterium]MDY3333259.1 hypothetical protein [Gallibacter sp.]
MYCKKCGFFLKGTENFCQNCGAKVDKSEILGFKKEKDGKSILDDVNIDGRDKLVEDEFNWEIEEPSYKKIDLEDLDFSWNTEGMFLHNEIQDEKERQKKEEVERKAIEDEVAKDTRIAKHKGVDVPVASVPQESASDFDIPSFLNNHDENAPVFVIEKEEIPKITVSDNSSISTSEVLETAERAAEIGSTDVGNNESLFDAISDDAANILSNAELKEDKKKIDQFFTFNQKKEEFQKLLDKEYERIEKRSSSVSKGMEEDVETFMAVQRGTDVEGTSQIEEMIRAREKLTKDSFLTGAYRDSQEEPKDDLLDLEVTDEIVAMPEELQAKPEEDTMTEDVVVDDIESAAEESDIEATTDSDDSLVDNMESSEEKPNEKNIVMDDGTQIEVEEVGENHSKVTFKPTEPVENSEIEETSQEESAPVPVENDTNKVEDTSKASVEEKTQELFKENDEAKPSKVRKFFLVLFTIIFVLSVIVIGIKLIAPTSAASRYIDKITYKVTSIFMGDSNNNEDNTERAAVDDKTGLIQLKLNSNYKSSVGTIKYNSSIKQELGKTYADKDILTATLIADNVFYKNTDGKIVYLDESIVGAIIEYESKLVEFYKNEDKAVYDIVKSGSALEEKLKKATKNEEYKLEVLEIGEIRNFKNKYYVWIIETVGTTTTKKVYTLEKQDKNLKMIDVETM